MILTNEKSLSNRYSSLFLVLMIEHVIEHRLDFPADVFLLDGRIGRYFGEQLHSASYWQ